MCLGGVATPPSYYSYLITLSLFIPSPTLLATYSLLHGNVHIIPTHTVCTLHCTQYTRHSVCILYNVHNIHTHSNDLDKVYYNCDKCEYKAGDLTQVETQFMWKQSNIGNAMKRIFSMPTNKTSLPAHNCDLYPKTV